MFLSVTSVMFTSVHLWLWNRRHLAHLAVVTQFIVAYQNNTRIYKQ